MINEQVLRESNLVRGHFAGIKILGDGELKHGLTVEADKVSAMAREKIEKAGGTITLREGRERKSGAISESDQAEIPSGEAFAEPASQAGTKKKSTRKPSVKVKSRGKKKASRES